MSNAVCFIQVRLSWLEMVIYAHFWAGDVKPKVGQTDLFWHSIRIH